MVKTLQLMKSLCVAAVLLLGSVSAWADDVASYNFNDKTTPFSIYDANRLSASYDLNAGSETDFYVKYSSGNMNAVAFAYYNFATDVSNAATVTLDFDFYIPEVAGHALISIADANTHTASTGGFTGKSNTGYGANGAIFNLGCFRGGGVQKFAINSVQNDLAGLDAWCHATVTVDNGTKKVDYIITKGEKTLVSASGVDFLNSSANRCSQIDLYIATNAAGNAIQIDNLVITKTVSETNHNYTVKAMAGETELKELASGMALENSSYKVSVPKVILVDGKYYLLNSGQANMNHCLAEFTMGTEDEVKEILYTLDEGIIFFKECEDIQQSYASETSSGGFACAYYANPQTVSISQPGVYQLETNVTGRDSNSSLELYTNDGTTAVAAFAKNCGTGIKTLNFAAEADMRVGGPYYNDKFNNSKSVDYILVRKLYDVQDIVGAVDYSTSWRGDNKAMTISKGEKIVVNFKNHGGANVWNSWELRMYQDGSFDHGFRSDDIVNGWVEGCVNELYKGQDRIFVWCSDDDPNKATIEANRAEMTEQMKDADVTMTIKYTKDGWFSVDATSVCDDNTYNHKFWFAAEKSGEINLELGVDGSWHEIMSIGKVVTATLGANRYTTFASPYPLDLTNLPEGVTAYKAKLVQKGGETIVDFDTMIQTVPAYTGFLLEGPANAEVSIPVVEEGVEVIDNVLCAGAKINEDITGNYAFYGMKKATAADEAIVFGRFYPTDVDVIIPADKAYLKVANGAASRLTVSFNGETTGISTVEAVKAETEGIYNLNGQRIAAPAKGLYIVNGKKVVLK